MRLIGNFYQIRNTKKSFKFLPGNLEDMSNSYLKSYVFIQSNLLEDRLRLKMLLPNVFGFDFFKNKIYIKFFQSNLRNSAVLKNLILSGNGALIFSKTLDFHKLRLLQLFFLQNASTEFFIMSYRNFIFDMNRLRVLSSFEDFKDLSVILCKIFFFKMKLNGDVLNIVKFLWKTIIFCIDTFLRQLIVILINLKPP